MSASGSPLGNASPPPHTRCVLRIANGRTTSRDPPSSGAGSPSSIDAWPTASAPAPVQLPVIVPLGVYCSPYRPASKAESVVVPESAETKSPSRKLALGTVVTTWKSDWLWTSELGERDSLV